MQMTDSRSVLIDRCQWSTLQIGLLLQSSSLLENVDYKAEIQAALQAVKLLGNSNWYVQSQPAVCSSFLATHMCGEPIQFKAILI